MEEEKDFVLAELPKKSDEELRDILDKLDEEEQALSCERRMLHGKIDILKAELKERLKGKREQGKSLISGQDIERLTEILARDLTNRDKNE